jgi:hypothetical protein
MAWPTRSTALRLLRAIRSSVSFASGICLRVTTRNVRLLEASPWEADTARPLQQKR